MGLWRYIARRLVLALLVLALVSVGTFLLAQAVPGDPVNAMISEKQAERPEVRAAIEQRWGLDRSIPVQYFYYVTNMLEGDLGVSMSTRRPVADDLRKFVPATIELTLGAMTYAILLGIPLGIVAAIFQNRWPDHVARFLALIGTSVPVFWLGLLFLYLFYHRLSVLPGPGRLDVGMEQPPVVTGIVTFDAILDRDWAALRSVLRHLFMPSIVHGSFAMGIFARMLRSSLVAAMGDDYVRTARAKGLVERRVVAGHALRNALIPTVTVLGLTFAGLLTGAVLTETIFAWPGVGQYAVKTATKLDYPGLLGVTLVIAVTYVLFNLIVDVAYGILDPRIRVG